MTSTTINTRHDTYFKPKKRTRVCLFGLSADPPTGNGGHLGIVTHLASMEMFDQIRVLPVYTHMFSVSFRHLELCVCVRAPHHS